MGGAEQVQQNPVFGPRSSLAELMVANDLELAKLLIVKGGLFDSSSISEHILTLCILYGKATKLITWAAHDEINSTKSEGTLFRGTSHASRLISYFFMQPIGQEYLKQIVAPLLSNMNSCAGSFEIDPEKLDSTQSADDNLTRLLSVVQTFLNTVIESRKKFPVAFSEVLSIIQQQTKEKFSRAEHSVIGGFVFLRFLCPAMVTPEKYNIISVPPSKEVRRGLVLLSKIMQNLANGVEFGMKEGFMVKLNSFVEKNMKMIADYFDEIAAMPIDKADSPKSRSDTVGITPSSKLSSSPTLQKSMNFDPNYLLKRRDHSSTQAGPAAVSNAKVAETLFAIEVYLQANRTSVLQGLPEVLQEQLIAVLDVLLKKEPSKKEEIVKPTAKVAALDSSSRKRSNSLKGTPSFVQSFRLGLDPKRAQRQQQADDLNKSEVEHMQERLGVLTKSNDDLSKAVTEITKERDFWKQVFDAAILESDQIKHTLEQTMAKVNNLRESVIRKETKEESQSLYEYEISARKAVEAENQRLREKLEQVRSAPTLTTKEVEDNTAQQDMEDNAARQPSGTTPIAAVKPSESEIIEQLQKKLWDAENEIRELRHQIKESENPIILLKDSSSGADSDTNHTPTNSVGSLPTTLLTIENPESAISSVATSSTSSPTGDSPPTSPTTLSPSTSNPPRVSRHKKSKSTHMLSKPSLESRKHTNSTNHSDSNDFTTSNTPSTTSTAMLNSDNIISKKLTEGTLKKSISIDGLDTCASSETLDEDKVSGDSHILQLESWQKQYSIKDKLKFFEERSITVNQLTNKQKLNQVNLIR